MPKQPRTAFRRPLRGRTRRLLAIVVVAIVSGIGYALVLARFDISAEPEEQEFGVAAADARIRLYLQPLAIDAVNASMQMRISVLPPHAGSGAPAAVADRDLVLT